MAFGFKARVLLELGGELISSDSIALYELVKNSLDAGSNSVKIDIRIALQHSAYHQLLTLIDHYVTNNLEDEFDPTEFKGAVFDSLEPTCTEKTRNRFIEAFGNPQTIDDIRNNLKEAYFQSNRIAILDTGSGMSLKHLSTDYLTVGTPSRLEQKQVLIAEKIGQTSRLLYTKTDTKIPLGEKGIGRLSAMRLGHFIRVKTKQSNDHNWHLLKMDWRPAFEDPNLDANDPLLDFQPSEVECTNEEFEIKGTRIYIRDLLSDWTIEKVHRIVREDLGKLADPYATLTANKFIKVFYQDTQVSIPILDREPLNYCDAIVNAKFRYNDETLAPELTINVDYKTLSREKTIVLKDDNLRTCVREEVSSKKKMLLVDAEIVAHALKSLGPWEMKFYWFNRGRIQKNDSELYNNLIQPFLNQWGGGLLVYRDGYRVYPYGERSDDWLALDKKALASGAYKLNRAQIAGYLRLTSIANPNLQDQTNREGFRDCLDKEALKRLLRYVIIGFCRPFLEEVEKQNRPPLEVVQEDVEKRISTSKDIAVSTLKQISIRAPEENENIAKVMHHLEEVSEAWERAKLRIASFDKDMESYVHLAGVGLMLEFIAHELSRVTQDTLKAITNGKLSADVVKAQLKTLEKRVRILDELSIPGRQIRKFENIKEMVLILTEFHQSKADRHEISLRIHEINPTKNEWQEKLEKGQFLQILDNLLSNSFYWLMNRYDKTIPGQINITLNPKSREILFSDNGPGIAEDIAEMIFDQFVSYKPPREGRGLGLYIARKLAEDNNAKLELDQPDVDGMYRTFKLSFGPKIN